MAEFYESSFSAVVDYSQSKYPTEKVRIAPAVGEVRDLETVGEGRLGVDLTRISHHRA